MSGLTIVSPRSHNEASELVRNGGYSLPVLKAGGMDVLDHMKEGLLKPDALVNIRPLQAGAGPRIRREGRRIRIDASTTLAELAASPMLAAEAPALADAAGSAATPQVRNVASVGGNLLQRPRCWYYRNEQFVCLKKGGATCYAVDGENKFHAIFGGGPCHHVHPSNVAPALLTMAGQVHLVGGERESVPLADLYHGPDRGVLSEHNLLPWEVISHVSLEPSPRSGFAVVKEKQSFDWPLVFAVSSLGVRAGAIQSVQVCAGAVAPVPWRLTSVENALRGVRVEDSNAILAACNRASDGAEPMTENGYKTRLLPVVVRRSIENALARGGR